MPSLRHHTRILHQEYISSGIYLILWGFESTPSYGAILYVIDQGRKWRGCHKAVRQMAQYLYYTCMNRWSKSRMLNRVFTQLQRTQIIHVKIEVVALDPYPRQGPSGWRGGKKRPPNHGGGTSKIHLVAADVRRALSFALSPGQAHDAQGGRNAAVDGSAVKECDAAPGLGLRICSRGAAQHN